MTMHSTRPRRSSYSTGEVEVLVEEYESIRGRRDTNRRGLYYLVLIADIDRALVRLTQKQREAVILHGRVGLSAEGVAGLLGITKDAVLQRYHHAIEMLTHFMNGGR